MAEKITCGRFSYDPNTNEVEGPGKYMTDQGNQLLDKIMAGEDVIFNMTGHLSPNPVMAVLVRLQTDFAGWKGVQDFNFVLGKKP